MADERNDLTASDVERKLRRLTPKPSSIDRDRLMYLAGQGSVVSPRHRAERVWRLATVVSTTSALVLAVLLIESEVNAPSARDIAQPTAESRREQPEQLNVNSGDDAVLVQEEAEWRETISERGRAMFALRHAVSESGASALSDWRPTGNTYAVPSVWDEVRAANLRESMARRQLRRPGQSKGLLGVFELGTKS